MINSLRLRLVVISVILVAAALLIVSQILIWLFERHVRQGLEMELANHLNQIAAQVDADTLGRKFRPDLTDPRFELPASGLYWQLSLNGNISARSRSLWDKSLDIGKRTGGGEKRTFMELPGQAGSHQLALIQDLEIQSANGTNEVVLVVAQDGKFLSNAVSAFSTALAYSLLALFAGLAIAIWVQITAALHPFRNLERQIASVRSGESGRLKAPGPTELLPVINEINALLDQQTSAIEKSQLRAGRLAHGLKTPMAILRSLTRKLSHREPGLEGQFTEQLDVLDRQVTRELARARTVGSLLGVRKHTHIRPLLIRLVAILERLPRGSEIEWSLNMEDDLVVPVVTDDLAEILGNILDNARKWAASRVDISAAVDQSGTTITIQNDGAPIAEDEPRNLINPGHRLNDDVAGSGLGLSIVQDVLSEWNGQLGIAQIDGGGLAVTVFIPSGA